MRIAYNSITLFGTVYDLKLFTLGIFHLVFFKLRKGKQETRKGYSHIEMILSFHCNRNKSVIFLISRD